VLSNRALEQTYLSQIHRENRYTAFVKGKDEEVTEKNITSQPVQRFIGLARKRAVKRNRRRKGAERQRGQMDFPTSEKHLQLGENKKGRSNVKKG